LCSFRYPLEVIGYLALMSEFLASIAGFVGFFDEVTFELHTESAFVECATVLYQMDGHG